MRKWLLALGLLCAAAPVHATICPSVPYTFSNGAVADATQVNADFTTILSCINANVAKSGINSDITSLTALTTLFASGLGTFGSLAFATAAVSGDIVMSGTGQLQLPVGTTAQRSSSPVAGMVRVNTTTKNPEGYGLYGDTSWQNIGVPSHAVMAFNLASCPTGWQAANGSNGTADMRGVVARGLDNGRGLDTSGTGLAGYEADMLQDHTHGAPTNGNYAVNNGAGLGSGGTYYAGSNSTTGGVNSGNHGYETRVKATVLLYCEKL